jgi:hypothetical protein
MRIAIALFTPAPALPVARGFRRSRFGVVYAAGSGGESVATCRSRKKRIGAFFCYCVGSVVDYFWAAQFSGSVK